MEQDAIILNLLLDRYERSGHCLPGRASNKRIMLNLSKGDIESYRENDPKVTEFNSAIETLAAESFITTTWRKGYEGWLYERIILNLDELDKAYVIAGREPLSKVAVGIDDILQQAKAQITTPWKLRFIEDECARLQEKLRTSRLLPADKTLVEAIMKVLQYAEDGPELMRVISANCFCDSKYLERCILSQLATIARAYEPELAAFQSLGDEHLSQNAVLEQIGILTYPEILEFCGNVRLVFPNAVIGTDAFRNGFCIQSENLNFLAKIEAANVKSLLFIENKTNYRHHILKGIGDDALVIHHGGFYSPAKRKLFCLLSESLGPGVEAFFWGDIDLGGFLMFSRLRKDIFPNLAPWRMGREDFEKYKAHGITRPSSYLELLRKKMEEEQFDPCFTPAAKAILEAGVTVEQEIML